MMEDWSDYNRIQKETSDATKAHHNASVLQYLGIKLVDNWILVILIILLILFSILGFGGNSDSTKTTWALHAGELCLGVFLGLFKAKN